MKLFSATKYFTLKAMILFIHISVYNDVGPLCVTLHNGLGKKKKKKKMDPVIQVCMWATQSMEIHYFTISNLSTGG